jgi:hypothetical protein
MLGWSRCLRIASSVLIDSMSSNTLLRDIILTANLIFGLHFLKQILTVENPPLPI